MANPLHTRKQSVSLPASAVSKPRIRRDPPPVVKEIVIRDRDDRNRQEAVIGIVIFALALLVIAIGFAGVAGWSPRQYNVHF